MTRNRSYNTIRIIFYALFPPRRKEVVDLPRVPFPVSSPEGFVTIGPRDVPPILADFSQATRNNRIALFFPDCFPIAGYFLLLRLKRQGFSSTRARAASGGVTLEAMR